jgi:hypothetical protein
MHDALMLRIGPTLRRTAGRFRNVTRAVPGRAIPVVSEH